LKQREGDFTNSGCRSDARSIASEFFYCCENIAMEDDGFELEYMGTSLNNEMIGRRFRIFQVKLQSRQHIAHEVVLYEIASE
jgi:hypothetical protein